MYVNKKKTRLSCVYQGCVFKIHFYTASKLFYDLSKGQYAHVKTLNCVLKAMSTMINGK